MGTWRRWHLTYLNLDIFPPHSLFSWRLLWSWKLMIERRGRHQSNITPLGSCTTCYITNQRSKFLTESSEIERHKFCNAEICPREFLPRLFVLLKTLTVIRDHPHSTSVSLSQSLNSVNLGDLMLNMDWYWTMESENLSNWVQFAMKENRRKESVRDLPNTDDGIGARSNSFLLFWHGPDPPRQL